MIPKEAIEALEAELDRQKIALDEMSPAINLEALAEAATPHIRRAALEEEIGPALKALQSYFGDPPMSPGALISAARFRIAELEGAEASSIARRNAMEEAARIVEEAPGEYNSLDAADRIRDRIEDPRE